MRLDTIPYSRLTRRFARFFVAWMEGHPGARGFLPGGPFDPGEVRAAVEARSRGVFPRAAVADALAERHRGLGSPARVLEQIAALREPGTVCVVAGQQPLLGGGPLFVAAKALTAIALAREVASSLRVRCVPLFWNHSDDHDMAEVDALDLLGGDGRLRTLRAGFPADRRPVCDVEDAARMSRLRSDLEAALEGAPCAAEVRALVAETFAPGPAAWFTRLLTRWFGGEGLVVFEPRWLAREAVPVLARALEDPGLVSRALDEGGKSLEEAGYPRPLPDPGTGVFVLHAGGRLRIDADGDRFAWAGSAGSCPGGELRVRLASEPASFSPGVALRPVVQDAVLPSVATVAGPNEASYLAQLGPLYRSLGVTRAPVVPRASVTIVPPEVARIAAEFRIPYETVLRGESFAPPLPADLAGPFATVRGDVEAALARLRGATSPLGPGTERNFEKTRARILESLDIYARRVAETAGRIAPAAGRGEALGAFLMPGGRMQEQALAGLWFVARFGPDLFPRLAAALDFRAKGHQVAVVE